MQSKSVSQRFLMAGQPALHRCAGADKACSYLLALFSGLDVDLGPLLEGLPQDVSDQGLAGDLHSHHVACTFQNFLRGSELAAMGLRQLWIRDACSLHLFIILFLGSTRIDSHASMFQKDIFPHAVYLFTLGLKHC